ncbi:HNH endonuclease [Buttiauxella sp. A111]|uniref:HNH endonuclease n=1 Tax=Buttiauxella sp. A111 TaxID=2563088 RepID=UPI0010DEF6A7|nr:HNH endonuclease [Buttiauxella sp. A111]GDX06886.1 hypothetical protein BSPA111_30990 [Buttiauxella sp. A111]
MENRNADIDSKSLSKLAVIVETNGTNFHMEGNEGYSGKWAIGEGREPKVIIIRKEDENNKSLFDIIVADIVEIREVESVKRNKKVVHFTNASIHGKTATNWEEFTGNRSYGSKMKYLNIPANTPTQYLATILTSERNVINGSIFVNAMTDLIAPEIEDVEEILNDISLSETQKLTFVEARRGQGIFRAECLKIYPACPVTGISFLPLLKASHIKPWRACESGAERLNPYNGIMLAAHIDVLFDNGYLSFTDGGEVMLSPCLDNKTWQDLNIKTQQEKAFHPKACAFLEWHRENVFKR